MSFTITIQGKVITMPSSGSAPNWAPAMIEFAKAVEAALQGVAGNFDVAPTVVNFDGAVFNSASNVDLTALQFPPSEVRAVEILYASFRETDAETAYESGTLYAIYSDNNAPGSKWEFSREATGFGKLNFNILDTGQVQMSTTALAGTASTHTMTLTLTAKALLQTQ